jgi:hypothetical protein
MDVFSVGVPGLDAPILSWIDESGAGIVLAPMDPWFIFTPSLLPVLATDWVRRYNLEQKGLRWMYWMPFDAPFNTFEWYPRWNQETKRYAPLVRGRSPIKLPERSQPEWISAAQDSFLAYYKASLSPVDWPEVMLRG